MTKKKPDLRGWGYSDDCAGFEPLDSDDDEYEVGSKWYTLCQNDIPIGRIRMVYGEEGNEWEVQLVGTKGKFSVKDDVPVKEQDRHVRERIRKREEDEAAEENL
jgi:hypothetical protein